MTIKPIKCDRCGLPLPLEEPRMQLLMARYRGIYDRVIKQDFDLCQDCAHELVEWIYGKQQRHDKTGG